MFCVWRDDRLPDMDDSRALIRLAAWSGAAAAVLYLVSAALLSGLPTVEDSGAEVVRWFGDNRGTVLASAVINGIVWLALLPLFATGLRRRLGGEAGTVVLAAALVEAALIGMIV